MIERLDAAACGNFCHRVFADEHRRRYALAAEALRPLPLRFGPIADASPVIVDAACGLGYGFEYLGGLGRYVGLDGSAEALAECRRRYPAGDFRGANLEGAFVLSDLDPDAIVCLETAEHLRDPAGFLWCCHLALAPRDGTLVFSAPTSLTMDFDPYHRRDWGRERWRDALRRAGFAIRSETPMPFTATFGEFCGTVPVTWRQVARVAAFDLCHPRYLAARLWGWGIRRRFYWESTIWVCGTTA